MKEKGKHKEEPPYLYSASNVQKKEKKTSTTWSAETLQELSYKTIINYKL